MTHDQILRTQLVNLLLERQAHMLFEDAVANFPEAHINTYPPHLDYSFWQLVEHIRYCQWDILEYIQNANYTAGTFPDDYWPAQNHQTDMPGWNRTIEQFLADRQALVNMINDPNFDLFAQIPHGAAGHNIVREIIIVGQHNAYHVGELGGLRQMMNLWT